MISGQKFAKSGHSGQKREKTENRQKRLIAEKNKISFYLFNAQTDEKNETDCLFHAIPRFLKILSLQQNYNYNRGSSILHTLDNLYKKRYNFFKFCLNLNKEERHWIRTNVLKCHSALRARKTK